MPRLTQIVPEHNYSHQMVVVNDNTTFLPATSSDSGNTRELYVFSSPKGRDNKIQTIDTGLGGFLKEYGIGPFSLYGQPLLNAYTAAASGAAILHCLRISADNAAYSSVHLIAKYKVDGTTKMMTVKFVAVPSTTPLSDLSLLGDAYTVSDVPDVDGFSEIKLLSLAYLGKGTYGDNIRFRVASNGVSDKSNDYKNYLFEVYVNDGGLNKQEEFQVVFNEDAIVSGVTVFSDGVVNDPDSGSSLVSLITHVDGFAELFDEYKTANPTTVLTVNDFDPFLGVNKYTKTAITNYTIDTVAVDAVVPNALGGVSLQGGSDGDFGASINAATRNAAIEAAYVDAFSGVTDPAIKSKNKFPTNLILDANFSPSVKALIAALVIARTDCIGILDCGIGITTKASIASYVTTNLDSYVNNRVHGIDAYAGKVRDPYTGKIVTVTSTYYLAARYATQFQDNGAKHVPLAGNVYGVISGFIKNSVYPIFDEDIDGVLMDELSESHINYARLNANQDVIRSAQDSRQLTSSKLSELNNVFVLLDIKRDAEKLCSTFDFNFSDPADIERFNAIARDLLGGYASAQVKSITAKFDKSAWEAERGIIHLYVTMVNRDILKTTIIEIDVNKA